MIAQCNYLIRFYFRNPRAGTAQAGLADIRDIRGTGESNYAHTHVLGLKAFESYTGFHIALSSLRTVASILLPGRLEPSKAIAAQHSDLTFPNMWHNSP